MRKTAGGPCRGSVRSLVMVLGEVGQEHLDVFSCDLLWVGWIAVPGEVVDHLAYGHQVLISG